MLKNKTVGQKIGFGFGVVLVLLAVVAILSYVGVGGIVDNASEVIVGNKLNADLTQREVDHLNWANQVNDLLTDDTVHELTVETDDQQCAFGKWLYGPGREEAERIVPSLKPLLKAIEQPHKELHHSAIEIAANYEKAEVELGNFLREKKTDHLAWAHRVKDPFVDPSITEMKNVEFDPSKCSFGRWLNSPEVAELEREYSEFASMLAQVHEPHNQLHESAKQVEKYLTAGERKAAAEHYMANTKPLAYETLDKIDEMIAWQDERMAGVEKASDIFAMQTDPALEQVQSLLEQIRQETKNNIMTDEAMLGAAQFTRTKVTIISSVAILVGIALAFFIARGIVRALKQIIEGLTEGADQVNDAAGQVSSASQQLAEGASEQASSLEETSSALEQMAAMTRTNAENAGEANKLSDQAKDAARQGDQTMDQLNGAMQAINESAGEISKIIKVIEEIAFQTNLLALNAAVEAARAGEHGKGFAVVADEVRSLAQRAAQAARETTGLIENSVVKAKEGADVAVDVGKVLGAIMTDVTKVTDLIQGIAKASQEQAQGVDQLNTAVSQVDKVTQQNASSAEESASASEQLAAQAQAVKGIVGDLSAMVGATQGQSVSSTPATRPSTIKTSSYSRSPSPEKVSTVKADKHSEEFMEFESDDGISAF